MPNDTNDHPMPQPLITETDLCDWLGQADPGDSILYHRGFLALDVAVVHRRLPEPERRNLLRVANRAAWAADNGLAHLIQRRHGTDDFSYFAILRPRPRTRSAALTALLAEMAA